MAKTYPLDVEQCGGDTYIVFSKGHHDPHEFMKAVREGGWAWPLGFPTYHWVKRVPVPAGHTEELGDCDWQYVFVKEGTRGAYPATYAHEAFGDDRYEAIATKCGDA